MATKLKYCLKDIVGIYPQRAGRHKHPLKEKYFGQQVSTMAVGHVDPKTNQIVYNEMVEHPAIKRIMKVGKNDTNKTQSMDG